MLSTRPEIRKFDLPRLIRFGPVGGVNTVVTYGVYVWIILLGVHYNTALACEYVVGIVLGYLLNRIWTFSDRVHLEHPFKKYIATYAGVFLINLVFLNALVWLSIHPLPAQVVALGLATLASYLLQRNWVFKSRKVRHRKRPAAPVRSAEVRVLETAGVND